MLWTSTTESRTWKRWVSVLSVWGVVVKRCIKLNTTELYKTNMAYWIPQKNVRHCNIMPQLKHLIQRFLQVKLEGAHRDSFVRLLRCVCSHRIIAPKRSAANTWKPNSTTSKKWSATTTAEPEMRRWRFGRRRHQPSPWRRHPQPTVWCHQNKIFGWWVRAVDRGRNRQPKSHCLLWTLLIPKAQQAKFWVFVTFFLHETLFVFSQLCSCVCLFVIICMNFTPVFFLSQLNSCVSSGLFFNQVLLLWFLCYFLLFFFMTIKCPLDVLFIYWGFSAR